MVAWMGIHPWMTFFVALGVIDAVRAILSPSCPKCTCLGTTPITATGALHVPVPGLGRVAIPHGNGVYHGLVRA